MRVATLTIACLLVFAVPAAAQIYDSENVVLLSRRDHYAGYNDTWGFVGNDGREYVWQGTTSGSAFWDVDDPVHPQLVTFIPGGSSTWRDAFVSGDYIYIGTENSSGGIQIVDISDPTNPTLVSTYTATVGNSHNVFGDPSRNLLFVIGGYTGTTNGGVQIFDTTDPINIAPIGNFALGKFNSIEVGADYDKEAFFMAYADGGYCVDLMQKFFDDLKLEDKDLYVADNATHYALYYKPEFMGPIVEKIDALFKRHAA